MNVNKSSQAFQEGLLILIDKRPELYDHTDALMDLFKEAMKAGDGNDYSNVYYVGRKPQYVDHLYKTGIWLKGKAKAIAPLTAAKLLRHPDLFSGVKPIEIEESDEIDAASERAEVQIGTEIIEDPPPDDPEQSELDQKKQIKVNTIRVEVEGMETPEQLRQYSRERLNGWEPDKRFSDPVKLREAINQHADMVGSSGIS